MADAAAVHRAYVEAVNQQDLVRVRELFDETYTYTGADGVVHKGPEAGIAQIEPFLKGFPDLRLDVRLQHVSGDTSIMEAVAKGTQTGDLGPIPATGKYAEVVVCDIVDVRDGKIVAEREYYNEVPQLQQRGVKPTQ
jgi:ketosteroid isomerase-like protein